MTSPQDLKTVLLCAYASGALSIREQDNLDTTTKKMLRRMDEIDALSIALREERDHITAALLAVTYKPSQNLRGIYTREHTEYALRKPFRYMSQTDACLKVLKDRSEEWLDKNQIEELVVRGGYESRAENLTNSVHVTLRRLLASGCCEAHSTSGSHPKKYRFVRDRESGEPSLTAKSKSAEPTVPHVNDEKLEIVVGGAHPQTA